MKIIDCQQGTAAWWEARRGVATASEFSNIITAVKGDLSKSAYSYACQLIGELYDPSYGQMDDYVSSAMHHGINTEPEARAWYEFITDARVQQVGFVTTDDGRFGCSPDALVGDDGGLELKCPKPKTHIGYLLHGQLPDAYKQQVHGSLAVSERDWWDYVSYCDGLPEFRIRIEPDDYTKRLAEALDEFWTLMQDLKSKLNLPEPRPMERPAEITMDDIPAMLVH